MSHSELGVFKYSTHYNQHMEAELQGLSQPCQALSPLHANLHAAARAPSLLAFVSSMCSYSEVEKEEVSRALNHKGPPSFPTLSYMRLVKRPHLHQAVYPSQVVMGK